MAYGDIGKIALSKTGFNPYNMNMKNTKAVFFIILGSFLLATGFAYAGEALDQLKAAASDDTAAVQTLQAAGVTNNAALTPGKAKGIDLAAQVRSGGVVAPAVSSAVPASEKDKKSTGETVKKWIGKNFSQIIAAVAIGFLAFMVLGTGGAALAVGAAAFGLFYAIKNL